MDKYDYMEVVYRCALFCVLACATGYIWMQTFIYPAINTGGIVGFVGCIIAVAFWIIIQIGVGAYLIFVARGSFRPKTKEELEEMARLERELDEEEKEEEKDEEPENMKND